MFLISSVSAVAPLQKKIMNDFYEDLGSWSNILISDYFENWNKIIVSTSDPNCVSANCTITRYRSDTSPTGYGIWIEYPAVSGKYIRLTLWYSSPNDIRLETINFGMDNIYLWDDINISICQDDDCISNIYNFYNEGFYRISNAGELSYFSGSNIAILMNDITGGAFSAGNFSGLFDGRGFTLNDLNSYESYNSPINTLSGTIKNLRVDGWSKIVSGGSPYYIRRASFIDTISGTGIIKNSYIKDAYVETYTGQESYMTGKNAILAINNYGTISNVYVNGTSYLDGGFWTSVSRSSGGLVLNNYGLIENSYADVITSSQYGGNVQMSGFVNSDVGGTIQYCHSIGNKRFATLSNGTTDTANFFDYELAGTQTSAIGTPKTTIQMKTLQMYINAGWNIIASYDWDMNYDWFIQDVIDYPRIGVLEYYYAGEEPEEPECPLPIFYPPAIDETLSPFRVSGTSFGSVNFDAFYENYTSISLSYYDTLLNQTISYTKYTTPPSYSEECRDGVIDTCLKYFPANPPEVPREYITLRITSNAYNFTGTLNFTITNLCGSRYDSLIVITSEYIPPDEVPASLFKNLIVSITSLFPNHEDLNFAEKSAYVLITMTIITIILLFATGSFKEKLSPLMMYVIGILNFMIFSFFIAIKYVSIGVLILTALLAIGVSYFRFRGGA